MEKFTAGVSDHGHVTEAVTSDGKHGFSAAQLATAEQHAAKRGEKIVQIHTVTPHYSPPELAVAYMRAHLGIHEQPPGSNRGNYVDHVLALAGLPVTGDPSTHHGWPWCAACACDAWAYAGITIPGGRSASCYHIRTAAQAAGRWSSRPTLGAMFIFHQDEHAGIVTGTPHAGLVPTIAGNTSQTNGANPNGGVVAAHDLAESLIAGYVLP